MPDNSEEIPNKITISSKMVVIILPLMTPKSTLILKRGHWFTSELPHTTPKIILEETHSLSFFIFFSITC
jgi:hypothetical protein